MWREQQGMGCSMEQGEVGCVCRHPHSPNPLEGAGLCAQGGRKAGVARVCLAGRDGAEVGVAGEEEAEGGSWDPRGDHALIQVK